MTGRRLRYNALVTPRVRRWRAVDLCGLTQVPCRYLFREYGEDDNAWKLVVTSPICELRPHGGQFLPELVTMKFADGTERSFNPNDQVETRPA